MNHGDAWVIVDHPPPPTCHTAKGHFLMIEKEFLVHPANFGQQPRGNQKTGTGDPVNRPGTKPPIGLVLSPGPWYDLLADRPEEAGEDTHGGLSRSILVPEPKPDDSWTRTRSTRVRVDPFSHLGEQVGTSDDVGVEDQEPRTGRSSPADVDAGRKAAVGRFEEQSDPGKISLERGGNRLPRTVIDDQDLTSSRLDQWRPGQVHDQGRDIIPALVIDDDHREFRTTRRSNHRCERRR